MLVNGSEVKAPGVAILKSLLTNWTSTGALNTAPAPKLIEVPSETLVRLGKSNRVPAPSPNDTPPETCWRPDKSNRVPAPSPNDTLPKTCWRPDSRMLPLFWSESCQVSLPAWMLCKPDRLMTP